jgi:hypothetical protein
MYVLITQIPYDMYVLVFIIIVIIIYGEQKSAHIHEYIHSVHVLDFVSPLLSQLQGARDKLFSRESLPINDLTSLTSDDSARMMETYSKIIPL